MKSTAIRIEAESLFVRHGRTLEEIAASLDAAKTTIARWSKAGDWVEKRQEFLENSPSAPLDKLRKSRLKIIEKIGGDDEEDARLIDALWKLEKSIDNFEARADAIGPTLDVMEKFARFVASECDAKTAEVVRAATEKFLDEQRRSAYA